MNKITDTCTRHGIFEKNTTSPVITMAVLLCACLINGCASMSMLPKTASEVDFNAAEGKVGWSSYQESAFFPKTTKEQIYLAAKAGLGAADFALLRADIQNGVVIGEHGMTLHDWNIIAGVYFIRKDEGFNVRVLVEGSKDVGFSGDATSGGWTGKILNSMRSELKQH